MLQTKLNTTTTISGFEKKSNDWKLKLPPETSGKETLATRGQQEQYMRRLTAKDTRLQRQHSSYDTNPEEASESKEASSTQPTDRAQKRNKKTNYQQKQQRKLTKKERNQIAFQRAKEWSEKRKAARSEPKHSTSTSEEGQYKVHPEEAKFYTPVAAKLDTPVPKKELFRLVEIGVLEQTGESKWGFPTFIVPKKDGRVRWVSDFRRLNTELVRTPYLMPNTNDIMRKRKGFTYMTKIDLSMGFYHFQLDEESQELCVIVTPFGKFKYKRTPMGVCNSPDIFQAVMHRLFQHMPEVECFIDDIGIFTNGTYEEHLAVVKKVLQILEEEGFSVNPLKCDGAVDQTDYLGYIMTRTGLKPMPKKVEALLRMLPPKTKKQARSFVGLVQLLP